MKAVSEKYDPPYLRGEREIVNAGQAQSYADLIALVDDFAPIIDNQLETQADPVLSREWQILKFHSELTRLMAQMLQSSAEGDCRRAKDGWARAMSYARKIEPEVHERFDVMEFIITYENLLKKRGVLD